MALRETLVQLTEELVAISSVSDDPAGREAVIAYIAQFCARLPGVHTARFESDGKPSLVAAFDDVPRKSLILNAHVDVVPARPEQFKPYQQDGRIYGRGTQDMKGAAAAMLVLLQTLAESGQHPSVSWQFVTDEELGGDHGTAHLFANGYTGDFFLAGEPTDLRIVNRAKGLLWVKVFQTGTPAHGSRPWDGSNPIVPVAAGITRVLERYPIPEEASWRTTVTVASVHGGDVGNRVPPDCEVQLDIRHIPEEDPEEILEAVRQAFPSSEVVVPHGGTPLETAEDNPHVRRLQALLDASMPAGERFRSEHFASDARFYSAAGIASVCFGPVGAGLHSHEEWVDIASLEQFYTIIYDLARSY